MLQDKSPTKPKNAKVNKKPTFDNLNVEHGTRKEPSSRSGYSSTSAKLSLVKSVPDRRKQNAVEMPIQTQKVAAVDNTNSSRISEVKLVSERVTKTKKEIEQLKEQLQKLINDGINKTKTDFTETKQNLADLSTDYKTVMHSERIISSVCNHKDKNKVEDNSELDINKAKTFKDNVANIIAPRQSRVVHSNITLRHGHKSPTKQEESKKIRHYDKEAAREYIKKQKEKRKESIKNQKKEVTFTHDIKKQRLQELRQKSLQLVSKNIQHKRERSQSRSREALNQFEHKHVGLETNDAQLQEGKTQVTHFTTENELVPNLIFNESHASNENTQLLPVKQDVVKFVRPELKNITIRSSLRDLSAIPKLDIPKHIQLEVDAPFTPVTPDIQPSKSSPPNTLEKRQKAAVKIQAAFKGYRQRKLLKSNPKIKKHATKEVQTNEVKVDVPVWLQAPTALPYPYNFINAVKRKLNLAVQQIANVNTNDVAVQKSFVETPCGKNESSRNTCTTSEQAKSRVEIKNFVSEKSSSNNPKNTNLKSFLSHKCLDLDIKAVEPLALTRNSFLRTKERSVPNGTLKTNLNGVTSDSDTSKNIPELSSENSIVVTNKSTHSSKHSHSSDTDHDENKFKINMDKVKKLKLRQPKRLNFSITDVENNSESIKSRRGEDISEHIAKTKSRSSSIETKNGSMDQNNYSAKDSIIAYNKCDYVQIKKPSTNKDASVLTNINKINSDMELNQHKSSERSRKTVSETVIAESITRPQDTLNSFRNYMKSLSEKETAHVESSSPVKSSGTTSNKYSKKSEVSTEKSSEKSKSKEASPVEKSQSTIKTTNLMDKPQDYSSNFTNALSTMSSSVLSLKPPSVSLRSSRRVSGSEETDVLSKDKAITNVTLRPGERTTVESRVKSNEIHLKFEAELHLLNDFNDSLRQVMAVEKSLLELHNTNNKIAPTYETRDTQTSFVNNSTDTKTQIRSESSTDSQKQIKSKTEDQVPTVNYSRGSDISEQIDIFGLDNTVNDTSLVTTGLDLSQLKDNVLTSSIEESNVDVSVSFMKENQVNGNLYPGLSLEMFEQLIKDEDARIENLKTILKIREKALVDRTKGELAWLEIQKKDLRDSGQLQEISAIKKKQRGLLIKLEHERHEMQRLKQMQKAASKERKSVLREQRNMIKAQLSNTNNMITKIKRNTKEERRQSGPLKVYNIKSHSESIKSETSVSRRSSANEEIISVVSHSQSIISHVTEEALTSGDKVQQKSTEMAPLPSHTQMKTEHVKRSLLMREATLQKRRKAAEELLQWHQRLVEEEGKIAELELAASAIINQVPTVTESMVSDESTAEKHKFKGSQLNLLWYNMTGREEKKFNDQMTYSMSKISLERFCKDAKKYSLNRSRSFTKRSGKHSESDSSLSAIKTDFDIISKSKTVSVKTSPKSSSSEKSKKSKSRSLHSLNESLQESTIIEDVISKVTKNKNSQVTDYTSDFESGLNTEEIKSIDNEQQNTKFSISEQPEVTEISSIVDDLHDDISWSDKDVETIAEKSKSKSKTTANTSRRSKAQPHSKTINRSSCEEKQSINERSPTEIIDDNSTTTNQFNELHKITNKHSATNSVIKNSKNTLNEVLSKISQSVTENASNKLLQDLELNQDSTSKDITTDIEKDNDSSTHSDEVKTKNESKLILNHNTSEKEETLTSNKQKTASNNFVQTDRISSKNQTSDEEIPSIQSDTIDEEDRLLSETNENLMLIKISEDQLLSEIDTTTNANQAKHEEEFLNELEKDMSIDKTNKDQPLSKVYDQLLSNASEDHLLSEIKKDQSIIQTHEDQILAKINDESLSKISADSSIKTIEDHSRSEIKKDESINKADDDQVLSKIDDKLLGNASEYHLLSEIKEEQLIKQTNEDLVLNKIDKDESLSENGTDNTLKTIEDQFLSELNEDASITKTDEGLVLSEINDQLLSNASEVKEEQSINETNSDRIVDELNENELLSEINEDESVNKTHEDQVLSKISEDELLNKTSAEDSLTKTSYQHVVRIINKDRVLSKNQLLNKTSTEHSPNKTNEDQLLSEIDGNPMLEETSGDSLSSKTCVDYSLNETSAENVHNKTSEDDQMLSKIDDELLTQTDEHEMLSRVSENELLSKTIAEQSLAAKPSEINEEQLLNKTNEDLSLSKTNEQPSLSRTNDDPLLSRTKDLSLNKTNEDPSISKTNEEPSLSKTIEDNVLNKTNNENKINENQLFSLTNENQLLNETDDQRLSKLNEDSFFNKKTNESRHPSNVKIEELPFSKSVNDSLDTNSSSAQSLSDKINDIKDENEFSVEEKPSISKMKSKTLEDCSDSETVSNNAHKLSIRSDDQVNESSYKDEKVLVRLDETNREEKEGIIEQGDESIKSEENSIDSSISKNTLSYGFVERKKSDKQREFDKSSMAVEDTSGSERESNTSNENSINSEDDLNDFNLSAEEKKSEDDMSQDLNETYEIKGETNTDSVKDLHWEEINTSHDTLEQKISKQVEHIDVKKRVSEILADANIPSPRGDKSPRLQDLYVTAYDVSSPEHSSESGSPTDDMDQAFTPPLHMYGSDEVEELLKKQLEIEQEIKEIQQQQQKEHLPYMYVREIPNKPPPPYTPPVTIQTPVTGSILPATEKQVEVITSAAATILHKAYLNKNLQNVTLTQENTKIMQNKNKIDKCCFEFVFDLCKEAAIDHYKQFENETGPSWMHLNKPSKLALGQPLDRNGLEKCIIKKVKQWLGYEAVKSTENIKHKWSGKKRDHVDELLVVECQAEEKEWTNYDRDELIVKDELTKDIMDMLLSETAQVFNNILNKKTFLC